MGDKKSFFLLILFFLFNFTANANNSLVENNESPPLEILMTSEKTNRVGDPVFVTFTLKNQTKDKITIKAISLRPDIGYSSYFKNGSTCIVTHLKEIHLEEGSKFDLSCNFEMQQFGFFDKILDFKKSIFDLNAKFFITAEIEGSYPINQYTSTTIKQKEYCIFYGGVIGALLLSIFIWAEKQISEPKLSWIEWLKDFRIMFLMAFRGGIMAVIALTISNTTHGIGAPISLAVSDFSGGLIVGLFSYPLAAWIGKTLKPTDTVSTQAEGSP